VPERSLSNIEHILLVVTRHSVTVLLRCLWAMLHHCIVHDNALKPGVRPLISFAIALSSLWKALTHDGITINNQTILILISVSASPFLPPPPNFICALLSCPPYELHCSPSNNSKSMNDENKARMWRKSGRGTAAVYRHSSECWKLTSLFAVSISQPSPFPKRHFSQA